MSLFVDVTPIFHKIYLKIARKAERKIFNKNVSIKIEDGKHKLSLHRDQTYFAGNKAIPVWDVDYCVDGRCVCIIRKREIRIRFLKVSNNSEYHIHKMMSMLYNEINKKRK